MTNPGYVYLPVSTPSHDFYGGERLGDNLFGDSLACLKASTGERVWHYQLIHHGLWDYDPPAAPILMDVEIDSRQRRIVALVTKQAFCYVFDRVTGEPIWPMVERPVPASSAVGERASPTQPFPSKPAPFDVQGLSEEDVIDFTPALKAELEILSNYTYGPLYTPPSERGTLMVPGLIGGADWAGAAADPERSVLYVPSHTLPSLARLGTPRGHHSRYAAYTDERIRGPQGLPLTKPPHGRITAIDMRTGDHLWMRALGSGPVNHPALQGLDLPDLGWGVRSFVLATPTLLLAASQDPREDGGRYGRKRRDNAWIEAEPLLRAFSPRYGKASRSGAATRQSARQPDELYGRWPPVCRSAHRPGGGVHQSLLVWR